MARKYTLLALGALLVAHPALAQNAASGSPRVQGAPDGFGDPVQVTIVGPNGADITGTTANQVQGNAASGAADTANTLLEVVTTTANTSGTASVNCQGHTGS